jgi:hypothetical protein
LLWTKKREGLVRQKRRLVAKNRVGASFQMGGLQMDSAQTSAQSLLLNSLQRLVTQSMLDPSQRTFMWELLQKDLEVHLAPDLSELLTHAGEKIWAKYSSKLKKKSPFMAQIFKAMAELQALNSMDRDNWLTAPLAGHGSSPPPCT